MQLEKKKWHFPGTEWLNAKLSRKIILTLLALAVVGVLISSLWFLNYLRSYVGIVYDDTLHRAESSASEVCSYLEGSDGALDGLESFLSERQLFCTVRDSRGELLFDSRPDAESTSYLTVSTERSFTLKSGEILQITVLSTGMPKSMMTGLIDSHVRLGLCVFIGSLFVLAGVLLYVLLLVPIAQLRNTMRKYYEKGTLPAHSERKDEIGRLQNTFADLTGVLAAKEQTERRMIASISHDIKTPLTSVLGCSERLLNAELSPEKEQQYLNSIHDKAISIKSIVDEFDDYISTGLRGDAPLQLITVQNLCDDLKKEYEDELSDAGVALKISCACPECGIMCNLNHMRRYFGNLIGNSIRHSGAEHLVLSLSCYTEEKNVIFAFSDNGSGVAPELLQQIFEPLFTSDRGRKVSGLGLAICKSIIRAHGGTVTAENRENGGLTVRASLPAVRTN